MAGPYVKASDDSAIDDGWSIEDGDGVIIAHLDTALLADVLLDHLLGKRRKEGEMIEDYPCGVPLGDAKEEAEK